MFFSATLYVVRSALDLKTTETIPKVHRFGLRDKQKETKEKKRKKKEKRKKEKRKKKREKR